MAIVDHLLCAETEGKWHEQILEASPDGRWREQCPDDQDEEALHLRQDITRALHNVR
ncbi:hypothetical protein [Micromonospora sp. KC723]|uniref:hypothetical protein n=1 Tax=Micromonospora sp. KC723 TaxID=2530381 RepID=UPI001404EE8A|nr:hypothetical protein [Micromonospora sp. KC723]